MEHGTDWGYRGGGCRCEACTLAATTARWDQRRRKRGELGQPRKVWAWRAILKAEIASEACDRIVESQPVPGRLLKVLGRE